MPLSRRQLLYAMLAALALAGLSGVVALLTAAGNEVWRIAGTCFVVAVAAGIMMPMSGWADKPATRLAGLFGMAVAVIELILAGVLIWGDVLPSSLREFVGWSTAIVGPCGLTAARFLKEIERPGWRWTAIAGALGCAAAGACWLLADWFESFGSWTSAEPFFSSGWSLLVSGGMCAFALVGLGSPDRQLWRWIGVAGALAGASVAMYGSFVRSGGNPGWIVGPYCLGGFVAHAIVSLRMNLTRGQAWVRLVAIVAAACTGFSATYSVAIRPSAYDSLDAFDWTWRITSAFALVCASASMAMLVLGLLNRRPTVELSRTRIFDRVTVICPRCEKKLTLPLGGALCDGCRLHIDVTVHTARCAQCSYDLTGLTAAVCPECGAPIPQGTTSIASPAA